MVHRCDKVQLNALQTSNGTSPGTTETALQRDMLTGARVMLLMHSDDTLRMPPPHDTEHSDVM